MVRLSTILWIAVSLCVATTIAPHAVLAHDANLTGYNMALGDAVTIRHDEDPATGLWAGWINLSVTNTGAEAWGDFHFNIGHSDVDFVDGGAFDPYMIVNGSLVTDFTYAIAPDGSTMDFYFYNDPVYQNDTVEFHAYNVNPSQESFFSVSFYPTPVPLPGALTLCGSGLLGLVGIRRRI